MRAREREQNEVEIVARARSAPRENEGRCPILFRDLLCLYHEITALALGNHKVSNYFRGLGGDLRRVLIERSQRTALSRLSTPKRN